MVLALALTSVDRALLLVIVTPIAALVLWGIVRLGQARTAIRASLEAEGLESLQVRRSFRHGPFAGTTSRGHAVYRVAARDKSGRERRGWARWGRAWLTNPDVLEMRWEE